jgi:phage tail-like protein
MAAPEPTLFGTSHFRVLIGRRELGFSEVSRLSSEADTAEVVVLRRALTQSTELYEWRRRVADGGDDRREVTIQLLDAADGSVVNSWRLEGAWPRRWSGPSFDAGGNAVAMEELELAYDDLVWLAAPDTTPTKERR